MAAEPAAEGDSLLDMLVERLGGQGPPAHQVWLPPLTTAAGSTSCSGRWRSTRPGACRSATRNCTARSRCRSRWSTSRSSSAATCCGCNWTASAGHVAVVGGPQSGKSTALRTLICALALTHTPAEAQVYCLDFGGGTLAALRELPHVGGVAGRLDTAAVRRTVGEVATLLADRERRFAEIGVDCDGGLPAAPGGRGGRGGRRPVRRRVPGHRRMGDAAQRVRRPGGRGHRHRQPGPVVRRTRRRVRLALDGLPAGDPRPVRLPAGAAARRPERLVGVPEGGHERAGAAHRAAASPQNQLHFLTALPKLDHAASRSIWSSRSPPPGPGRPRPGCGCCRPWCRSRRSSRYATRTSPCRCRSASPRPTCDRCSSTSPPSRTSCSSATPSPASPPFLRALATTITSRFTPEQARLIIVDYRRSLLGAVAVGPPHRVRDRGGRRHSS